MIKKIFAYLSNIYKTKSAKMNKNISFLLGSGFSIPDGVLGVREINQRLKKIDESEILIHSDMRAIFLNGQKDPNRFMNWDERQFVQEFLNFHIRNNFKSLTVSSSYFLSNSINSINKS